MKHTIKFHSKSDPLFSPWDMIVEDTRFAGVPVVQSPHPCADDNLVGFEREFGEVEVFTHDADWPTQAVGLSPVFANKSGMYSVRDLIVDEVIVDAVPWDGSGPNPDGTEYADEAFHHEPHEDLMIAHIIDRRKTPLNGYWVVITGNPEKGMREFIAGFREFSQRNAIEVAKGYMRGYAGAIEQHRKVRKATR